MLDSLHIKNFRCFEDLTIPSLGRVNLIVGKNNSGKSTLLEAVSVFVAAEEIWSDQDDMEAVKVIDQMRQILSNRNAIFIKSGSASDAEVYLKTKRKEAKNISFEDVSKKYKLEIAAAKSTENIFYINIKTSKSTINLRLNAKGNIQRYWEDEDYLNQQAKSEKSTEPNDDADESNDMLNTLDWESWGSINDFSAYDLFNQKIRSIPSGLISENDLSILWDAIYEENKDSYIYDILKIILPKISSLNFSKKSGKDERVVFIKEKDDDEAKPIRSMGEGILRLLQIFLYAFLTRHGYLCIDEFENGLHYSIQEEVWEKLFKLAKELDIQVFATTHSEDTIKAFCKVSLADDEVDGKLISLGRSAAIADNGKILADVYDEKTLAWIVQSGMEVR